MLVRMHDELSQNNFSFSFSSHWPTFDIHIAPTILIPLLSLQTVDTHWWKMQYSSILYSYFATIFFAQYIRLWYSIFYDIFLCIIFQLNIPAFSKTLSIIITYKHRCCKQQNDPSIPFHSYISFTLVLISAISQISVYRDNLWNLNFHCAYSFSLSL